MRYSLLVLYEIARLMRIRKKLNAVCGRRLTEFRDSDYAIGLDGSARARGPSRVGVATGNVTLGDFFVVLELHLACSGRACRSDLFAARLHPPHFAGVCY